MHYGNRGWFFPLIRQVPGKRGSFNIVVLAFGMVITTMHGYLNASFFSHDYKHQYGADWLTVPREISRLPRRPQSADTWIDLILPLPQ